jgi:hypothetical protein
MKMLLIFLFCLLPFFAFAKTIKVEITDASGKITFNIISEHLDKTGVFDYDQRTSSIKFKSSRWDDPLKSYREIVEGRDRELSSRREEQKYKYLRSLWSKYFSFFSSSFPNGQTYAIDKSGFLKVGGAKKYSSLIERLAISNSWTIGNIIRNDSKDNTFIVIYLNKS